MAPEPVSLSETFLQQGPACHWMWNSEGVFQRVYGDPAAVFNRAVSGLEGLALTEALEPALLPRWRDRFQRALAGETVTLRERHGKAVWYLSVFPLRCADEIRYVGGSAREITPWAAAEQELRYTVLGALKAQEYERSKTARFLHDTVGQNLTALGLQLDLVRMDLENTEPQIRGRIEEIQKLLESMMEQVRDYSYELNPSTVERAGLRPALDRLGVRMRERFAGALRVNVDPSMKIDPKFASAMYQIAQEAVENAVQHSGCSVIEIAVKSTRTGTSLEVRDDGKGFDPADLLDGGRGLGLLSMEHYAAQAGLDLSIQSSRGMGTTVRVAVPAGDSGGSWHST
jgi:signal transduction histidine kinase